MATKSGVILGPDPYMERAEWREWHAGRIGSSLAPAIMGCDIRKRTITDVYDRIVDGTDEVFDEETADFLAWRARLEDPAASLYAEKTGRKLRRVRSKAASWEPRLCTAEDREIVGYPRGVGSLEIKTSDPFVFKRVERGDVAHVFAQAMHHCLVAQTSWVSIGIVNVSSGKLLHMDWEPEPGYMEDYRTRLNDLLHMISARTRPERQFDPARMPAFSGSMTTIEDGRAMEFMDLFADWDDASKLKAEVEGVEGAAKERMTTFLRAHNIDQCQYTPDGSDFTIRVFNSEQAGRESFDKKALAKSHPDIDLSRFTTRGQPFRALRRFVVKADKE